MLRIVFYLLLITNLHADNTFTPYSDGNVPKNVTQLWANIDVRSEPLDTEIIQEWIEDGITCRYVIFTICTVKGIPSRLAAFYTFPEGAKDVPAFVWAHGGGQRAERQRGNYFAKRGYATIDINWNGREIAAGIEKNTDWGKIDPTQGPQFYPNALRKHYKADLQPDEHTIDSIPSPRNSNWFILGYAARRAITFLEQQPEVDATKIGLTGYSMGGNITSYAAIDPRVKAAIPMVGGTGFLTEDFPGVPQSGVNARFKEAKLFATTVDSNAHWPLVDCPVLFLNASNDFHGIMDRSQLCVDLLPHDQWRLSYNLHFNHSLSAEQWAMMNRWFDHYLKGNAPPLPATPPSTLKINANGNAIFTVTPDPIDLKSVEILYSYDPKPQTRFWKTATAKQDRATWFVELPLRDHLPLHIFAQCTYHNDPEIAVLEGKTSTISLTSRLHVHSPATFKTDTLHAMATHVEVFHDFTIEALEGWGSNANRTGIRTYKTQDPDRKTPAPDTSLVLHFGELKQSILCQVILSKNEFLQNGKQKQTFICGKNLPAGPASKLIIPLADLHLQGTKTPLSDWEDLTNLSLNLLVIENGKHVSKASQMAGTELQKITWQ